MRTKRTIPFEITGIDSLGQGVSKLSDKVTFIPKTSPGDKGEAVIMSEKKGVIFARLESLSTKSELRRDAECRHYGTCHSCHFLHMSYQDEIKFKLESFQRLFRKLPLPDIEVIAAPERFKYRNRVQLHYSLKTKLLGMKDPINFQILPIPHCLIAEPEILSEMNRLYRDNTWVKEAPSAPMEGHVEIYLKDKKISVNWNRPYAEGGFTQVYGLMNQKLKERLAQEWQLADNKVILDLFAGNGNLSQDLPYSRRLCVDIYDKPPGPEFLGQNLYDTSALKRLVSETKNRKISPKNLLLDPPRSGMKDLSEWLEVFRPQSVAYVSCDPHTLNRDLMSVSGYSISKAFLIDFFPSTFHFESMIFLERKE